MAAAEIDRGALRRLDASQLTSSEQQALDSVLAADAMPSTVKYRFECTVCGDRFELRADVADGTGGWTREPKAEA